MANNPYANKVVFGGQTVIDLTSDTVDASHLAQGYTAHDASGALITGTMTGGASNFVQGTFTPSVESGFTNITVNVPYTGTGHPVYFIASVAGGVNGNSDWAAEVVVGAMTHFAFYKMDMTIPTYNGGSNNENVADCLIYTRRTASGGTGVYRVNYACYNVADATNGIPVIFQNNKAFKYYAKNADAGSSAGFLDGIEYEYCIVYSDDLT